MSFGPQYPSALIVLTAILVLSGCGAPGSPQPPSLQLPKPVSDLAAFRKGDHVFLTWTPPTQTADGENIRQAGSTGICRGVAQYPMTECEEKVGTVADAQVEHWTKDTMASRHDFTDTIPATLQQQNPLGEATYALLDMNRSGRAAGLSNQVRVPLAPTLAPPADTKAQVTGEGVALSWTPAIIPATQDLRYLYRVFRRSAVDPNKPELVVGEVPAGPDQSNQFLDRNIEWEQQYAYRIESVTQVEASGKEEPEVEGDDSDVIAVLTHDVFPPTVPTGVQAVFSGVGQKPFIDLTWAPNLESDLAGYNVYRHEQGTSSTKINDAVVKTPAFRDANVQAGHIYFYSVSAVDLRGNESGKSEQTNEKVP